MAASTLTSTSEATAATSLPPAVRVRLYELFVQVRYPNENAKDWQMFENISNFEFSFWSRFRQVTRMRFETVTSQDY